MNDDIQQPAPLNINQQPNLEPQAPPPQPGQQFKPETPLNKPKKSKKKIILTILLLLALTSSAAAAYFFFFKKDAAAPASEPQSQQTQENPKQNASQPVSLITTTNPVDLNTPASVSTLQLSSNETISFDRKIGNYGGSIVHNNKVALVGNTTADFPIPPTVFISNDNGTSFTELWKAQEESDSITDIAFSTDGSKLLIASLKDGQDTNKLIAININDNSKQELVTIDQPGVFLYGYNADKNQVIYAKQGCWGCGGSVASYTPIFLYDGASKKTTEIYETKLPSAINGENLVIDSSFTNIFFFEAGTKDGEVGPELTGPFAIKKLNIASKQIKTLRSFGTTNVNPVIKLGFIADSTDLYYQEDKSVYQLNQEGKSTLLFKSSQPIYDIYWVGKEEIYVGNGDYTSQVVNKFSIKDQSVKQILKANSLTVVGITTSK